MKKLLNIMCLVAVASATISSRSWAGQCSTGCSCVDFQPFALQTFAGPHFNVPPLLFTNPADGAGKPKSVSICDYASDGDDLNALCVGSSGTYDGSKTMSFEFPVGSFPTGVDEVLVELFHQAKATFTAYDDGGSQLATAGLPSKLRAAVTLRKKGIRRVHFEGAETAIYKICWRHLPYTPKP